MEPIEILAIGALLFLAIAVVILSIRSSIRSSTRAKCEARWSLPSFQSKHVHIETEPGKIRIKVSGAKALARHHYGVNCIRERIPEAGDHLAFADEALIEPHFVSFFAESVTRTHHYGATPDRFRGTVYGSRSGAFISGEVIPGTEAFDLSEQVANGRVQITFQNFKHAGPKGQSLTAYLFDLDMDEAIDLLQWVLRHPAHVKEHIYGAPESPLLKVRNAFPASR